jgi:23S rRNA pseudouridine1911/1915/1917 synthase
VNEEPEIIEQDEQELYEHHRIEIPKGQAMLRVDKYLMNHLENSTRSKIQTAIEAGCVVVNGKTVKSNYKVKPLDVITIVMAHPPRDTEIYPENIPIKIVYEDEDVIVVNKDPGMVVHPGYGNYKGTLVNALAWHFQHSSGTKRHPVGSDPIRPGLVHRIDKNTSGLVVVAKNELAMSFLAKQFFERSIDRTYIALVWGDIKEDTGTITGHIGRSLRDRKIMTIFKDGEHGKHAVTHYKVLKRFGYVTLVECKLETGRTHQIRAHFRYIGHPLFNDDTYGGNRILKGTTFTKYRQYIENCFQLIPRQALHAKSLGFIHPSSKKHLFFDSDLPADFKAVIEKWRGYAASGLSQE